MKKRLKRFVIIPLLIAALALSAAALTACGEEETAGPVSSLRGTFTYNATIGSTSGEMLYLTDDPNNDTLLGGGYILYCDSAYTPFNNAGGGMFSYQINQNLVLARDFTYVYTYSVIIKNPQQWGATFGRMETTVSGTFEYTATSNDDKFDVLLSAPTGGTQEICGIRSNAGFTNNYWLWTISDDPTYAQNFDYADCFSDYDYRFIGNVTETATGEDGEEIERLTGERELSVDRSDNSVNDDMFDPYLYEFMARYGKY